VNQTLELPASFLLIAALNPCPCGFLGDKTKQCTCSKQQIQKYLSTLSGPLLDRIDLQVPIMAVSYDTIKQKDAKIISSYDLKSGVDKALEMQKNRFNSTMKFNNGMKSDEVEKFCVLTKEAEQLMKMIFESYRLSMRGYHKLLKVARTIADLEQSEIINEKHVSESIMYRCLDQYIAEQIK
jgi:magnesium chelatase family protein